MSAQNVRNAIERFLSNDKPQVLCIRGAWGTGKTYTWDDVLKTMARDNKIVLTHYAHASLFGLNSVGEIKREIFQSTVPVASLEKPFNPQNVKDYYDVGRKNSNGFLKILGIWSQDAVEVAIDAVSMLARNMIVMIDDLERKGEQLRSIDILGYVSQIRWERGCKVVLLLNDVALDDEERQGFESYLEKVVDVHLRFEPTAQEIGDIALPGNDKISKLVRERAVFLGISNVRVIRKLHGLAEELAPLLTHYAPIVTENAVSTMVLMGWSFFQPEVGPDLEYLKRLNTEAAEPDNTALDLKWRDLLRAYRFSYADSFDLCLLKGIERGYFEADEIDQHASLLHQRDIRQKVEAGLRDAWTDFHYSFNTTAADVLDRFFKFIEDNIQNMILSEVYNLAILFRDLEDTRYLTIIDRYIDAKKEVVGAFSLSEIARLYDKIPDDIRERIDEADKAQQPPMTVDELFLTLVQRGFDREITSTVSMLPVKEYVRVFKSNEGQRLSDILNAVRQYLSISNPDESMSAIMDRAGDALQEIAKESKINERRAMRYGLIQRVVDTKRGG